MRPPQSCALVVSHLGDLTLIQFRGSMLLSESCVPSITEPLERLIEQTGCRKLVLDFGNVELLPSIALGMLITLHTQLRKVGGQLILCKVNPEVYEVFVTTQLVRIFDIRPDIPAELAVRGHE